MEQLCDAGDDGSEKAWEEVNKDESETNDSDSASMVYQNVQLI
jgi:hypothetical protein